MSELTLMLQIYINARPGYDVFSGNTCQMSVSTAY